MITRKTNQGQPIDFDALTSKSSPNSPALGNMKTNAKGDVLGPNGEIIQKSEDRVRAYYQNNPKSSTDNVSLRGPQSDLTPDEIKADIITPKTSVTASKPKKSKKTKENEPLGYNEVEQPNGDFEMVPYYNIEDKIE